MFLILSFFTTKIMTFIQTKKPKFAPDLKSLTNIFEILLSKKYVFLKMLKTLKSLI